MKIVIGTMAPPKVKAIEECVNTSPYFKGKKVEIIPMKVDSGISDMPLSIEENMEGAKNRAINCKNIITDADFYIGMEGGTTIIEDKAYLFGVVYILNKDSEGHFGFSNKMEVPNIFQKRLYENKEDLGVVLTELTGIDKASKKNGAFGAWSDDTITRKDQFSFAFMSAIPAFFNKYYKL